MSTISTSPLISAQNLALAVRQMSSLSSSNTLSSDTGIFSNCSSSCNTSGLTSYNSNNLYQYCPQQTISGFISKLLNFIMMRALMNYIIQAFAQLFNQQGTQSCNTQTAQPACNTQTPTNSSKIRDSVQDIVSLTKKNVDSDLKKQKGTSYVVICGDGCGRCTRFKPVLESINKNLGTDATFYNLNSSKNKTLCSQLMREAGSKGGTTYGYPIILKYVDGKAEGLYSYADISKIYTDTDKMTDWFSDKIEK